MSTINRQYLTSYDEALVASFKRDPEFKKLWQAGAARRKAVSALIGARIRHKLSQAQLAHKAGIKQPSLARAESGRVGVSVDFLGKVARALGKELDIRFIDPRPQGRL